MRRRRDRADAAGRRGARPPPSALDNPVRVRRHRQAATSAAYDRHREYRAGTCRQSGDSRSERWPSGRRERTVGSRRGRAAARTGDLAGQQLQSSPELDGIVRAIDHDRHRRSASRGRRLSRRQATAARSVRAPRSASIRTTTAEIFARPVPAAPVGTSSSRSATRWAPLLHRPSAAPVDRRAAQLLPAALPGQARRRRVARDDALFVPLHDQRRRLMRRPRSLRPGRQAACRRSRGRGARGLRHPRRRGHRERAPVRGARAHQHQLQGELQLPPRAAEPVSTALLSTLDQHDRLRVIDACSSQMVRLRHHRTSALVDEATNELVAIFARDEIRGRDHRVPQYSIDAGRQRLGGRATARRSS